VRSLLALPALILVVVILRDAFETIVLPRRVTRRLRITGLFYRGAWAPWRWLATRLRDPARRDTFLSYFGPLSLLFLIAFWAVGLICSFGLLQWALGSHVHAGSGGVGFKTVLYFSGTNFFTLGLGDVTPTSGPARLLTVLEAGTGFAFLALVIGYLPVLYQAFSGRELHISLLDARAGSPPTAGEFLSRAARGDMAATLADVLQDWERWCAELLGSHLSYPVLAYYRSQHEHHSWLGALTMVLDGCALILTGIDGIEPAQARLTFAVARHTAVDLSQIFSVAPRPRADRLPPEALASLRRLLAEAGLRTREGPEADAELAKLRHLYEPYVESLSAHLLMPLPPWRPRADALDDWQTSPWKE